MFKKILVPLDGSPLAEYALTPAANLARAHDAELILVSVPRLHRAFVEEKGGIGLLLPHQSLAYNEAELSDYLAQLQERPSLASLKVQTKVVSGDAASVVVDTAVVDAVDLIVMTTHGRSGISHWIMGSVTERVVRAAPCHVLVIKDNNPINHTVIAVDGSVLAERGIAPGATVAHNVGSDVALLQVLIPSVDVASAAVERAALLQGDWDKSDEVLRERVLTYLSDVTQGHRLEHVRHAVVFDVSAAAGILHFAEEKAIDLIVMTTHGYTGLRRWAYGSVTEKVLRSTPCAMLIVRIRTEHLSS